DGERSHWFLLRHRWYSSSIVSPTLSFTRQQGHLRFSVALQVVLGIGIAVEKVVQPLAQLSLEHGLGRLADQVPALARIVLQIVQLVRAVREAVNVLPLGCANGPGVLELEEDDIIP